MIFNPEIRHERAYSDFMLERHLNREFNPSSPMGNYAISSLGYFINSFLVGKDNALNTLPTKIIDWLDYAINKKEKFGVNHDAHLSNLFKAMALAKWLQHDVHDSQLWDQARIHEELSWTSGPEPWGKREIVTGGSIDDHLSYCYLAGKSACLVGIEKYEEWIKKPTKVIPAATKYPRRFGYALCVHTSGQQTFPIEKLFDAGRGMLRVNLQEEWLGAGQIIRAATWLKIVYSLTHNKKTPKEILLAAYDDMPDVKRPDFV